MEEVYKSLAIQAYKEYSKVAEEFNLTMASFEKLSNLNKKGINRIKLQSEQ